MFATVVAVDSVGNTVNVSSDGLVVDGSPPVAPRGDGAIVEAANMTSAMDSDLQGHMTLTFAWMPFVDVQTGVDHYEIQVVDVTDAAFTVVLDWASVGNATTFRHGSLPLAHARTYAANVRAFNGAGGYSEIHSNGVALDVTAPVAGTVVDGLSTNTNITSSLAHIAANWYGFSEPDSMLDHYVWCVGSSPGLDDIIPCNDVGTDLSAVRHAGHPDLNLTALFAPAYGAEFATAASQPGAILLNGTLRGDLATMLPTHLASRMPRYYSTVTFVSELGMQATSYSSGVSVDVLPPRVGTVIDAASPVSPDVDLQSAYSYLAVSWFGFVDQQSRLARIQVSIGTHPGANDVATTVPSTTASSHVFRDMRLTNGVMYYATVTVFDEAGNAASAMSDGVFVDSSGPEFDFVTAYSSGGDATDNTTNVQAALYRPSSPDTVINVCWGATDPESGVAHYEVAVCPLLPHEGLHCAIDWVVLGLQTCANLTGPQLVPGVAYTAHVRATSGSGVQSSASSQPFVLDDSAPAVGTVETVSVWEAVRALETASRNTSNVQAQVLTAIVRQGDWDAVAVQWGPWQDMESGVVGYAVCVGTSPFGQDIAQCHDVGYTHLAVIDTSLATPYAASAIAQPNRNVTSFFITVIGTSGANMTSSAVSQEVQVDATPPTPGIVLDGLSGSDASYATQAGTLCVVAEGFEDAETNVVGYEMCVTSTGSATPCDVSAFRPAAIMPPPELSANEDTPAPLASSASAEEAMSRPTVLPDEPFDRLCVSGLQLTHGMEVNVTVRALNGVGHVSDATSDGVTVVISPPATGHVFDVLPSNIAGGDVDWFSGTSISARWVGFAIGGPAPAASYEVAVCGNVSGCDNGDNPLSSFIDIGYVSNITLGTQGLNEGEEYRFYIKVTDAAGVSATASSNGFVVDTTPPTAGVVQALSFGLLHSNVSRRGVDMNNDALQPHEVSLLQGLVEVVKSEGGALWHGGFSPLHLAWHSFGDTQSALASFRLCVGTTPENAWNGTLVACRVLPANATYTVIQANEFNASAVAEAETAAAAAAANGASSAAPSIEELDAAMDEATGLVPDVNVTADVRAAARAMALLEGCNVLGLCTPVLSEAIAVDLSPPVPGLVTALLDGSGNELLQTADTASWIAEWDSWSDPESGVAMYSVAVVDVDTGAYAMHPAALGTATEMRTASLQLLHGHRYATEVTATNFAGQSSTAVSEAVTVDTTPPAVGFVYDVFTLDDNTSQDTAIEEASTAVDADFGDAEVGAIQAAWGDWSDAETGPLTYEWAVMVLDPRQSNPIAASKPGTLLRDALRRYYSMTGLSLVVPPRAYGVGSAATLHQAERGVMVTEWVNVGNATTAYRADLDVITGNTYVVLLRATNGAGLQSVATSDGIVFDEADPCMGVPHAGLDPAHAPAFLSTRDMSATWSADADPLNQWARVPFECRNGASDSDEAVAARANFVADLTNNSTNTTLGAGDEVSQVAVVPISHMEWRVRMVVDVDGSPSDLPPADNSTFLRAIAAGPPTGLIEVNETTSQVVASDEPLDGDNSTYIDDTPPEEYNTNATTEVVMDTRQAGPAILSPWSGCCSSYSELNPVVSYQEWDWRPVRPQEKFGQSLAIAGRVVIIGGAGGAVAMDTTQPLLGEMRVTAGALDRAVGNDSGTNDDSIVHAVGDELVVLSTSSAVGVYTLPAAGLAQLIALSPLSTSLQALADDETDSQCEPSAFDASGTATLGEVVAVVMVGTVPGTQQPCRAVRLLRLVGTAPTTVAVLGTLVSTSSSFATSVALASPADTVAPVLTIGTPRECRVHPTPSVPAEGTFTTTPCAADAAPAGGANVSVYSVGSASVSQLAVLPAPGNASAAFGSHVAASGSFVVVGDPASGSLAQGQIAVYHSADSHSVSALLCVVPGVTAGGGLGYSVAVTAANVGGALLSGNSTSGHPRNDGTAIVVAGSPGGNLVAVIRVNASASVDSAARPADVCKVVAVVRASPHFQASSTQASAVRGFGAGTAVAVGGGMVAFSSPFDRSWPNREAQGSADLGTLTALSSGTGRVFGTAFCWSGEARVSTSLPASSIPSTCMPCAAENGEWGAGGISTTCELCEHRECRAPDEFVFSAVNATLPLHLGREYEIDVTSVARSGRSNTQTSHRVTMDWTPPTQGHVWDAYVGNSSDCLFCSNDIDAQTNATYLSVAWCCGWGDLQSGISKFHVAFGHSPDTMDILDWTDVGLVENYTHHGVQLTTGTKYYACVVAQNGAGIHSNVSCTDGFVYDDTPPVMLEVFDGLDRGTDIDTQSFVNIAFTSFVGEDPESGVFEYVFGFGSTPGQDDLMHFTSAGNVTFAGVVNQPWDRQPLEGQTVYAVVYVINNAGLVSPVMSSDGFIIGRGELNVDAASGGVMALDPATVEPAAGDSPDEEDVPPAPTTVAMVDIPAGAVGNKTKFVGGGVSPADIENGDAVNASHVPPPAQNMRFGNYSFTLKALGDAGVQEGFVFQEPVRMTMLYDVGAVLEGEAAPEDWQPSLQIYDIATASWISAEETCPPEQRYSHIDRAKRKFTVDICHLTQFGVFYQRTPRAVIVATPATLLEDTTDVSSSRTLARLLDASLEGAEAYVGNTFSLVRLSRVAGSSAFVLPSLSLDGSDSFDPDGDIVSYTWHATGLDGDTNSTQALTFATPNSAATSLAVHSAGVMAVQLTVVDDQQADATSSLYLWIDRPPTAVLRTVAVANAQGNGALLRPADARWPTILVHTSVDGSRGSVVATSDGSVDPEGAALTASWLVVADSHRVRYSQVLGASDMPMLDVASPTRCNMTNLVPGIAFDVAVTVTSNDTAATHDTAVATVVVNAAPMASLSAPPMVFLLTAETSFSVNSTATDLDGTVVRTTWSVSGSPGVELGHHMDVSSLSNATTVVVYNLTQAVNFTFQLEVEDSDGAVAVSNVSTVAVLGCDGSDTDSDGTIDCFDGCPRDPAKTSPGPCGCGRVDNAADSDGDGVPNCVDMCPTDADKVLPGICGCGSSDSDTDGDVSADCHDGCPSDANKVLPGVCGCGVSDLDTDGDDTADCLDNCPTDALRIAPGVCNCGAPDCAALERLSCGDSASTVCGVCKSGFVSLTTGTGPGNSMCLAMPVPTFSSAFGPHDTVVVGKVVTFTATFTLPVSGITAMDFGVTATGGISVSVSKPEPLVGGRHVHTSTVWAIRVSVVDTGTPWCLPNATTPPRVSVSMVSQSGTITTPNLPATNNGFALVMRATDPIVTSNSVALGATTDARDITLVYIFAEAVYSMEDQLSLDAGPVHAVTVSVQPASGSTPDTRWEWVLRLANNLTTTPVTARLHRCNTNLAAATYSFVYEPVNATITAVQSANPTRLPTLQFVVDFTRAVDGLDSTDFIVVAPGVDAAVTLVQPSTAVTPPSPSRRLAAFQRWDVEVTVAGRFTQTNVVLGLVEGGTIPGNKALPAVGVVGQPHVAQYQPTVVDVAAGDSLQAAGFTELRVEGTSLLTLDVVLDFGAEGVSGLTPAHIRVDTTLAFVVVVTPLDGSNTTTVSQRWRVEVLVNEGQDAAWLAAYLDDSVPGIVPPPAVRKNPILAVHYIPEDEGPALWAVILLAACAVLLCAMCVAAAWLANKHMGRGRITNKVAAAPNLHAAMPSPQGVVAATTIPQARTTAASPGVGSIDDVPMLDAGVVEPTGGHARTSLVQTSAPVHSDPSEGFTSVRELDHASLLEPAPPTRWAGRSSAPGVQSGPGSGSGRTRRIVLPPVNGGSPPAGEQSALAALPTIGFSAAPTQSPQQSPQPSPGRRHDHFVAFTGAGTSVAFHAEHGASQGFIVADSDSETDDEDMVRPTDESEILPGEQAPVNT